MSENVRRDEGSWISGPCATPEPVPARDIQPGDIITHDGLVATVTKTTPGQRRFGTEWVAGVRIEWEAGNTLGTIWRRLTDTLERLQAAGQ